MQQAFRLFEMQQACSLRTVAKPSAPAHRTSPASKACIKQARARRHDNGAAAQDLHVRLLSAVEVVLYNGEKYVSYVLTVHSRTLGAHGWKHRPFHMEHINPGHEYDPLDGQRESSTNPYIFGEPRIAKK
jgi:hypothetical protein